MAKSSRSKSEHRSRAILYARVFKPVEDARTARLSAKIHAIPSLPQYALPTEGTVTAKATTTAKTATAYKAKTMVLLGLEKPKGPQAKRLSKREAKATKVFEEFNAFGWSKREIRF